MAHKFKKVIKRLLNKNLSTVCRHYVYYICEMYNLADELRDKIDF